MIDEAISGPALSKLRWRCRRGLLENDLLIERLFDRPEPLTRANANGLYALMQLDDHSLLDLFLARREPEGRLDRADVRQVLDAVRSSCHPWLPEGSRRRENDDSLRAARDDSHVSRISA